MVAVGDDLYFAANDCVTSGTDLFTYNYKKVGIRNVLFDAQTNIYPNPVEKDLHIDFDLKRDEKLRILVADMMGKAIYDGDTLPYSRGRNKTSIPMKNMPAGAYIYYIKNEAGTTYLTGKVIKQ